MMKRSVVAKAFAVVGYRGLVAWSDLCQARIFKEAEVAEEVRKSLGRGRYTVIPIELKVPRELKVPKK